MQLSARLRTVAPARRARSSSAAPPRPTTQQLRPRYVLVRAEKQEQEQDEQQQLPDVEEVVRDLASKWDSVEDKGSLVWYTVGIIALVWLSSVLTTAVEGLPVIPKLMELIGLGYTAWFVYRYLLFPGSREELAKDVDVIKRKVTGGDL